MSATNGNKWFIYLLQCNDDSLYCGITTNPKRRLAEHNKGSASKYTRSRLPCQFHAVVGPVSHSNALKLELKVKRSEKSNKLNVLLGAVGPVLLESNLEDMEVS